MTTKIRENYINECVRLSEENITAENGGNESSGGDEGRAREPTKYLPGTPHKIRVMGERYALGLPIFLPGDARHRTR